MSYNEYDDGIMGDAQDGDGVNRANGYLQEASDNGNNVSERELVDELNAILMAPRYDNDMCVTLTMPVQTLKKAKEKINFAVVKVFERHKSPDFHLFDVLVALESMVDASVISAILDMDLKRMIANDRGIEITDQQLEDIASGKVSTKIPEAPNGDIVTCPKCGGSGEIDGDECPLCRGIGKVRKVVGPVDDQDDYEDDLGDLDSMDGLDEFDDSFLEE